MSHFTKVKTTIAQKKYLRMALDDIREKYRCEVFEGNPVYVRGWNGQKTACEIRLDLHNGGYDIGFQKEQEVYSMVADWWQGGPLHNFPQRTFIDNLTQRYAYHAAKEELSLKGFSLKDERVEENGAIRLTLRRLA
ncbi:DUF1257 domain-containing protein [bacterium]|nr:DUF1257 domain-containing protein [bacterium]